jgi:hypothetical protein
MLDRLDSIAVRGDASRVYPAQQAAPGWYVLQPGTECWWDGYRWTVHVRPVSAYSVIPDARRGQKAVTYSRVPTSHAFHLLMTLLTCGLWLMVWIPMIIINSLRRQRSVTRIR